jgi:putative transposase
LYQARKRYGLSVLDYMITSNHIHLLVFDHGGRNVIPDSIKLVAGRTGQEYNVRKNRKGAFWEDRYHLTAVESSRYLRQCITYIDINMVRTGVVTHPSEWETCGYNEIQNPRKRKRIIDFERLIDLLGFHSYEDLKADHFKWIDSSLQVKKMGKEDKWAQSVAVGSRAFVENIKESLGFKVRGRKVIETYETSELRETQAAYCRKNRIVPGNLFLWQ